MCGRVFDPEEVSETKLNPLKGRKGDRWRSRLLLTPRYVSVEASPCGSGKTARRGAVIHRES